jgi:hypothetical protein
MPINNEVQEAARQVMERVNRTKQSPYASLNDFLRDASAEDDWGIAATEAIQMQVTENRRAMATSGI